jgi:hypothetical protein
VLLLLLLLLLLFTCVNHLLARFSDHPHQSR